jgi:hypothetical protein
MFNKPWLAAPLAAGGSFVTLAVFSLERHAINNVVQIVELQPG